MWLVSIVSIAILVVLCAIGTFFDRYDDNLLQRAGMGCIAVGYGSLNPDYQPLAHAGLALFALGTAFKVYKHNRRKPPRAPKPPAYHKSNWAG